MRKTLAATLLGAALIAAAGPAAATTLPDEHTVAAPVSTTPEFSFVQDPVGSANILIAQGLGQFFESTGSQNPLVASTDFFYGSAGIEISPGGWPVPTGSLADGLGFMYWVCGGYPDNCAANSSNR